MLGCLIGFAGLYVAFFYTSYYGQATGYTSESLSFYLVPILNAASVFGRTIPNWLADKIGPANVIAPGKLFSFNHSAYSVFARTKQPSCVRRRCMCLDNC